MVKEGLRLKTFLGKRKASKALSFQVEDLRNYPQHKDSISLNFKLAPIKKLRFNGLVVLSPTKGADFSYQTGDGFTTKRAGISYQTGGIYQHA